MRSIVLAVVVALFAAAPRTTAVARPVGSAGSVAPTQTAESAVRRFFSLIDAHRVAEAVAMLGPRAAPDAGARTAWSRQFAAIAAIKVGDVRSSALGDQGGCPSYRVTLDVRLAAGRGSGPSYGWGPNPNLRWVTLCQGADRSWRISSIGTGP